MPLFEYNGKFWDLWRSIKESGTEDRIIVDMNNHPVICGFVSLAIYLAQRGKSLYLFNTGRICDKVKKYAQASSRCNLFILEDKPDFLEE